MGGTTRRPRSRLLAGGLAGLLAILGAPAGAARVPVVRTAAGSFGPGSPREVNLHVAGLAAAGSTVYVADDIWHVVRAFDTGGRRQWVVAGTGNPTVTGAGGAATKVAVGSPTAVAAVPGGGFVVAGGGYVYRVDRAGRAALVAGGGDATGPLVDGERGTDVALRVVSGLAAAADGTVYVADTTGHRVLAFGKDGTTRVVAGTGVAGFAGLGGPARALSLNRPRGLALTAAGDLLVADTENNRVVRVDPLGLAHPFAGVGREGAAGDGGPAVLADVTRPTGVAVTPAGEAVIAERAALRRVARDGTVSTLLRTGEATHVAVAGGDVYYSAGPRVYVRRASGATAVAAGLRPNTGLGYGALAGGVPTRLQTWRPLSVAVHRGAVYWTDEDVVAWRLRAGRAAVVTANDLPFYDPGSGDAGRQELLTSLDALAVAPSGQVFVADTDRSLVYALRGNGRRVHVGRTRICVPDERPAIGDGGPAATALLCNPGGLAATATTLYVADTGHDRVRAVDGAGRIRTVAGTGTSGFAGDGGRATAALLDRPQDVAVGPDGSLYVADTGNHVIRRIDRAGVIHTIAGTVDAVGYSGDGGSARAARFSSPTGIAVGRDGTVYVADQGNSVVRRIDRRGIVSTVAGNGRDAYSGDGGPARAAGFGCPRDVAVDDTTGRLYVADTCNNRVRVVQL